MSQCSHSLIALDTWYYLLSAIFSRSRLEYLASRWNLLYFLLRSNTVFVKFHLTIFMDSSQANLTPSFPCLPTLLHLFLETRQVGQRLCLLPYDRSVMMVFVFFFILLRVSRLCSAAVFLMMLIVKLLVDVTVLYIVGFIFVAVMLLCNNVTIIVVKLVMRRVPLSCAFLMWR